MQTRFKVLVHGRNLIVPFADSTSRRLGFFASRIVRAESKLTAIQTAIKELWEHPQIQSAINAPDDPPSFECDSVVKLRFWEHRFRRIRGFSFYAVEITRPHVQGER